VILLNKNLRVSVQTSDVVETLYMYDTKEITKYKGYVIQPYYHCHQALNKRWGYRVWKGYELMCVDEIGCKSFQEAIKTAIQEIEKGSLCRLCSDN